MKYSSVSSLAALLLTAGQQLASASPLRTSGLAPIYTPPNVFGGSEGEVGAAAADGHLIPDKYIVVLKESHGHHLDWHLSHLGANVLNKAGQLIDYVEEVAHHFTIGDFKGYAGRFSEASLEWIRSHPAVEYVERDSIVKAMDIENGAPWGLARISHRKSLSLGTL
jgi:cerevisin